LTDVITGAVDAPGLDRVDVVQPVLWAIMVSLAQMWQSAGVTPDAVVGHSQGEVAAAYVAGALTLREAAMIVALRSRLLTEVTGHGAMVSLACGSEQAALLIAGWADRLGIAAVNGVSSVVVSGDPDACEELIAHCETHAVRARRIEVDYASHSAQVETIREPLIDALDGLQPRAGSIAFYSTVTGGLFDTTGLDTRYWFDNAREPVLFAQATQSLIGAGFTTFIECSPHPLLALAMEDTAAGLETAVTVTGSLRRDEGGLDRFWKSVGHAYVAGAPVDWTKVYTTTPGRVGLPTYAFQRQRFWLDTVAVGHGDPEWLGLSGTGHPLVGAVVGSPDSGGVVVTGRLSLGTQPWLADHAVAGVVLFPGSGFVELVLRAGDEVGATAIQELTLLAPLVFTEDRSVQLQVLVGSRDGSAVGGQDDSAGWSVSVYTRDTQTDTDWTLHAEGVLTTQQPTPSTPASSASVVDLAQWPPAGAEPVQVSGVYDWLARHGYQYGPAFQG
ncbi:acyltransferase domain-containing protein, partial [Nocardia nepalensis]|uniref:acyltransferase domain-containing protein n=1 Tax=Nocardia nepalensis TaxID=3375448 RepID=UPI003B674E86